MPPHCRGFPSGVAAVGGCLPAYQPLPPSQDKAPHRRPLQCLLFTLLLFCKDHASLSCLFSVFQTRLSHSQGRGPDLILPVFPAPSPRQMYSMYSPDVYQMNTQSDHKLNVLACLLHGLRALQLALCSWHTSGSGLFVCLFQAL